MIHLHDLTCIKIQDDDDGDQYYYRLVDNKQISSIPDYKASEYDLIFYNKYYKKRWMILCSIEKQLLIWMDTL